MGGLAWQVPIWSFAMVAIARLIVEPYRIWREQHVRILKLEKIDDLDLENMLNGRFCNDTFIYESDITPCKPDFRTKYEIEKLRDKWVKITVPAPKNSFAEIKFQFFNGHSAGKVDFYVQGQQRNYTQVNMHSNNDIFIDSKSCFYLTMTHSDDYVISNEASLRMEIVSWKK